MYSVCSQEVMQHMYICVQHCVVMMMHFNSVCVCVCALCIKEVLSARNANGRFYRTTCNLYTLTCTYVRSLCTCYTKPCNSRVDWMCIKQCWSDVHV